MNYHFKNAAPTIPDSVFIAPNATVIGDVIIGENSSVWFNTVIRGDVNRIRIGERTNIQDNSTLHVTYQKWGLEIGNNVTVGHGAILHGCTISSNCLIGMGARILDGAHIGKYSLVAAGSLVLQGEKLPSNSLAAGVPAVVKRSLTDEEIEQIDASAERYVGYKEVYRTREFGPVEF
ncbi:MAG: gamma carbonic anhydrase family protein [bacterium]